MEGWKSFILISIFAPRWNAEGIRLYTTIIWVFTVLWFIAGFFSPTIRAADFLL